MLRLLPMAAQLTPVQTHSLARRYYSHSVYFQLLLLAVQITCYGKTNWNCPRHQDPGNRSWQIFCIDRAMFLNTTSNGSTQHVHLMWNLHNCGQHRMYSQLKKNSFSFISH